ncbi:MAG: glucosaminidase domain-containing protein [Bdellovibrionota bacterium]|nr:glucosaminidase domain-containing protein [Bdellovibrionota bacterium]
MKLLWENKLILITLLLAACGPKHSARLNFSDSKNIEERSKTYEKNRKQEDEEKSHGYFSISDIELKPNYIQKKETQEPSPNETHIGERENGDDFYFEFPERFHRYGKWNWKPTTNELKKDSADRLLKVILPKSAIPYWADNWVFEHFQTDFYELLEIAWKEPDGSEPHRENHGLDLPQGRSLVTSLVEYQELLNSAVASLPIEKQIEKKINSQKRVKLDQYLEIAQLNEISPNADKLTEYCGKINREPLEFISSDTPLFFTSNITDYTFDQIEPVEERKRMHFCTWLPLILQANEEVLKERDWLTRIYKKPEAHEATTAKLQELAKKYRIDAEPFSKAFFAEAFFKIDIVPPTMALAQVSLEGGWTMTLNPNKNRSLSTKCNNYFNIYDFSKNRENACKASKSDDYIKFYKHLIDSVRDYVTKVNSHPAYVGSRLLRLNNRINGKVSGAQMILGLSSYAEDPIYFRKLWWIMHDNHLYKYDDWYKFSPEEFKQP